jgi:hypothetical protein
LAVKLRDAASHEAFAELEDKLVRTLPFAGPQPPGCCECSSSHH